MQSIMLSNYRKRLFENLEGKLRYCAHGVLKLRIFNLPLSLNVRSISLIGFLIKTMHPRLDGNTATEQF